MLRPLKPRLFASLSTVVALLLGAALPDAVNAQCQIQSYTIVASCPQVTPQANVTLAGGTPPYQLTFTSSNAVVVNAQANQNGAGNYPLNTGTPMVPPVSLVVSDAMGCIVSSSAFYTMHVPIFPQVWFEQACGVTSSTLFWNGLFTFPGGMGQLSPCSTVLTYSIWGGPGGVFFTGAFPNDWTQLTNGLWRFNTSLAAGSVFYNVALTVTGSPAGGCLSGTGLYYCHATSTILTTGTPCGQRFKPTAALAGALPTGTLMNDQLRSAGLLPTTEPYTALGYAYTGAPANLTIAPSALTTTGNNAIVDWVVVELRSATSPATVLYSEPALLQRDGDVVDVSGLFDLNMPLPPDFYHVAIRHRNHLGIMTAAPVWLNKTAPASSSGTLNFRSTAQATYGTAARVAVGSVQCLWPGDADGNGTVAYTGAVNDRDPILSAIGGVVPTNTVNSVYSRLDLNLDGTIKYTGTANDRDLILNTIGGVVPTNIRQQQLP